MDAQENQIFTTILIAIGIIGSIIAYFVYSVVQHQHKVVTLQRSNARNEITALEKDRARIAADLHDEISPILSAIKLKISSFELSDKDDILQQQKTNEHLNDLLRRMREISFDLMPVTLQRRGLKAALQELVGYWSGRDDLQIELRAEDIVLSEAFSIHLYRIAQEIIHNTVKHANATYLLLELKKEKDQLLLKSRDNGQGFDHQKKLEEGGGFGLRNLFNRADLLQGEIFFDTAEGKGTEYTIAIPLN